MGNVIKLHDHPFDLTSELGRELVVQFVRYVEGLTDETTIRKRYRFDDEVWKKLGEDDTFVEAVEKEKTRRIMDGSTKRQKAQVLVTKAPDVLSSILLDANQSARHRIDSARLLDDFANNDPAGSTPTADRFIITINLGDEVLHFNKSIAIDADDIDHGNSIDIDTDTDTDTVPQNVIAAIAMKKKGDGGGQNYL